MRAFHVLIFFLCVIGTVVLHVLAGSAQAVVISQDAAVVLSEFFVAVTFNNATPVTVNNACSEWPQHVVCNALSQSIKTLNFTSQQLSGTLPTSLSRFTGLTYFNVADNSIGGTLPPEYSPWGASVYYVSASINALTGSLPPEYHNWTLLNGFDVTSNQLS